MTSNTLQQYKILVEFLGKALGPDFEIVLQDLTDNNNAIIAIANEHISGRTVGSPLTNTALQMLSSKFYKKNDYLCNYEGITEQGHTLRSSTMFIKNETGTPIGLLCINFDDSRYEELVKNLHSLIHPVNFHSNGFGLEQTMTLSENADTGSYTHVAENFPMDISTLMQKIFDDTTASLDTPANRLNQSERKEVMVKLNEQGLFQLKGAISFVAKKFSCSTATIYRYLSEISS